MMRKIKLLSRAQSGDTIVEVLICVAVLSLVSITTYVSISSSYSKLEDTQEHSRAVKLIESQIEELRQVGNITLQDGSGNPGDCFQYAGNNLAPAKNNGQNIHNPCVLDSYGQEVTSANTEPAYTIQIVGQATPGVANVLTYKVSATWPGIDTQTNSVSMVYRTQ